MPKTRPSIDGFRVPVGADDAYRVYAGGLGEERFRFSVDGEEVIVHRDTDVEFSTGGVGTATITIPAGTYAVEYLDERTVLRRTGDA